MLQRTALVPREDSRIEEHGHRFHNTFLRCQAPGILEIFAHENDTAARTAEGLVGCRGNDVCILHGVVEQPCCDKSCRMSHVDHQQCPHLVGNLAHTLIVPFTAVSGATADDELRLVLPGEPFHLVIVDTSGLPVERIAYMMIEDA